MMNTLCLRENTVNRYSPAQSIPRPRAGTTLLEVMFAIFVVVVGLLGIASILPLAARNASDSNAHNNAQALGQRWFQNFSAFRLNEPNAFTASRNGYDWVWFNGTAPRPYVKTYSGVGPTTSVWANQSICIDPIFFTEPDVRPFNGGGVAAYQTAVFPYYADNYNPITDALNSPPPPPLAQPQPRMLRVTLGQPNLMSGQLNPVSRKLVEDVFVSPDDIAASADETDKTLPAFRLWASANSGITKGLVSGQYSWLATLAPVEPVANLTLASLPRDYLLSLVVMNRRDRQFIDPLQIERPLGERLVDVISLSGNFQNGTGGRIRISAHGASSASDRVHVGDWIMLGTHRFIDPFDNSRSFAKFRWYRIIGLSQDSQRVGDEDNFVWSRDLVLEGPDFEFVPGRLVQGTLMSGVVTVVERNISIK